MLKSLQKLKTLQLDGSNRDDLEDVNIDTDEQGKDTSVDEEAQREEYIDIIEQKDSCAETDSENCGQDCAICLQGLGKLIRGKGYLLRFYNYRSNNGIYIMTS